MNSSDYPIFRDRVLAKTNGANIHKVNGKLGIIINSLDGIARAPTIYKGEELKEVLSARQQLIDNALIEIKKETGISA